MWTDFGSRAIDDGEQTRVGKPVRVGAEWTLGLNSDLLAALVLFGELTVIEPIELDDFRSRYELIADGLVSLPVEFQIAASNGEIVRLRVERTVEDPDFQAVTIQPIGLPSETQTWGRRFAGPRLPVWAGLSAAVESVGSEAAFVRDSAINRDVARSRARAHARTGRRAQE